jgi:hypothetical protein
VEPYGGLRLRLLRQLWLCALRIMDGGAVADLLGSLCDEDKGFQREMCAGEQALENKWIDGLCD